MRDEHGAACRSPTTMLRDRVLAKLDTEPIEDLRIDFEDGYGRAPTPSEDARGPGGRRRPCALAGAPAVRWACAASRSRRRPAARAIRTLDLSSWTRSGRAPHRSFVVTLPKVSAVEQVEAMVALCATAGGGARPAGPAAVRAADRDTAGGARARRHRRRGPDDPRRARAAASACTTAPTTTARRCGIAAAYQTHGASGGRLRQGGDAGRGRRHRRTAVATAPPTCCRSARPTTVHAAWQLHARLVRRSLERGFYQGWDLHPAQLPTRFGATYAFFRDGAPAAARG